MKASMQTLKERPASSPKADDKLLRSMGNEFGSEMAQNLEAENVDSLVTELASYWAENKLGRIRWLDRKKRVLRIEDYEQSDEDPANISRNMCQFKRGYLEAVLRTRLGKSIGVDDLRSDSSGKTCLFRINE